MAHRHSTYLSLLCLLNYVDALFTLVWVRLGIASEANPLMQTVVDNPPIFVLVKVVLVSLCCVLLYKYREYRLARLSAVLGFAVYTAILLIHSMFVVELVRITT